MGLIAEWNLADLTQFVSAGAPDYEALGAPAGTPTLSVVNVTGRGNVLRYLAGGAVGAINIFMFSAASGLVIPSTTERRDFDVEIEVYDDNQTGFQGMGIFFMGDADTPVHGFSHLGWGDLIRGTTLNNGTVVNGPAAPNAGATRFHRYKIRGRKPAGAFPEVSSYVDGHNGASQRGDARRSGISTAVRGSVQDIGNNTTLGATWNSISADRLGLYVAGFGGGNPNIDILSIRILSA
jgi:hypothetical protein